MQLLNNRVLVAILAREPLVERFRISKHIRKQEVEERPKLVQVVLKRGAGNQEAIPRVEHADDLGKR